MDSLNDEDLKTLDKITRSVMISPVLLFSGGYNGSGLNKTASTIDEDLRNIFRYKGKPRESGFVQTMNAFEPDGIKQNMYLNDSRRLMDSAKLAIEKQKVKFDKNAKKRIGRVMRKTPFIKGGNDPICYYGDTSDDTGSDTDGSDSDTDATDVTNDTEEPKPEFLDYHATSKFEKSCTCDDAVGNICTCGIEIACGCLNGVCECDMSKIAPIAGAKKTKSSKTKSAFDSAETVKCVFNPDETTDDSIVSAFDGAGEDTGEGIGNDALEITTDSILSAFETPAF